MSKWLTEPIIGALPGKIIQSLKKAGLGPHGPLFVPRLPGVALLDSGFILRSAQYEEQH